MSPILGLWLLLLLAAVGTRSVLAASPAPRSGCDTWSRSRLAPDERGPDMTTLPRPAAGLAAAALAVLLLPGRAPAAGTEALSNAWRLGDTFTRSQGPH